MDAERWTPSSWRSKPVAQAVDYPDVEDLASIRSRLTTLPPLVTPGEVERLRSQLVSVQSGQAFLLHAGDCAESFDACTHVRKQTFILSDTLTRDRKTYLIRLGSFSRFH
ncbi:hypothetical protein FRC14_007210 [Serendipita sp. 396]|nr:hypothetical protein FRC14_007210 [Serendipita sp. 396]